MNSVIKYLIFGVLVAGITSTSCRKEVPDLIDPQLMDSLKNNRPPVANAGPDQSFTLPKDTVTLDGSGSSDPDNNILGYSWSKISGPASFNIKNVNAMQTDLFLLVEGVYSFELKVTDSGGLYSKDTVQISLDPVRDNSSPVANAGSDVTVNYDLQTCGINPALITLNGIGTADQDRPIVSYLWSGPAEFSNPQAATTQVKNLDLGVHEFVLTVEDDRGSKDMDTMYVKVVSLMNRPRINAQLVPVTNLPQSIIGASVAAAGTKILFAVGSVPGGNGTSDRVDIYDISSGVWSIAKLSEARWEPGVVVYGNKIFLAGGYVPKFNGSNWYVTGSDETRSAAIDIYDVANNTWNTVILPNPMAPVGAAANNYLVFAASDYWASPSGAAIYNLATDSWSTFKLSAGRRILATTIVGDKIFFAGGEYPNDGFVSSIDVYNAATNIWSVEHFGSPYNLGWAPEGIAVGDKNYWAGGWYYDPVKYVNPTNHVEIRDARTSTSRFACLCQAKYGFEIVTTKEKIVFFTGWSQEKNIFDIYDIRTDTWSIGVLPRDITQASVVTLNHSIYVAGGYVDGVLSDQLWKLEF